ncbi:MAG: hypothetical protein LBT79_02255 [Elusimicrobiota bacterium]|jgi:hypothetical protein|nr:hypothetical protein [Elusimicrobiota bacterium]
MLNDAQNSFNNLSMQIGKIDLFLAVVFSSLILTTVFYNRKKNYKRYQERLRKAYDGLSPEEYNISQ